MAVCDVCKRDMKTAASCDDDARARKSPLEAWGVVYQPVPRPDEMTGRCGDCGAMPGGLHHPGCSHETCPKCEGLLLSCGCFDADDLDDPYDF